MSNPSSAAQRWTGKLTLLAVVLAVVLGIILLIALDGQGLDRLRSAVRSATPLLSFTRLLVIAGLYLAWPSLLRIAMHCGWIRAQTARQLLSRRARLAMWLIILELILGLDAPNRLHALIVESMP